MNKWAWSILAASVPMSCGAKPTMFELDVPAKDIAYCPATSQLYVSVPGAGDYVDTVVAVSTADASVLGSVPVGSNPGPLVASNDAAIGYVGLNSNGTIVPIDLAAMTTGSPFALGSSDSVGTFYAESIAVMPGAPGTVAVSRRNVGYSPRFEGVIIYDGGVARAKGDTAFLGSNVVAFGADPGVLYGSDDEDSDETLYRYTIDATGISAKASASYVTRGANRLIVDGQTIYSSLGYTVDGPTFTLLGTFQDSGPFVVDPVGQLVSYVSGGVVTGFDSNTYVPLFNLRVKGATGFSKAAAGCGPWCVGVVFDSGQVFVIPNVLDPIFSGDFD